MRKIYKKILISDDGKTKTYKRVLDQEAMDKKTKEAAEQKAKEAAEQKAKELAEKKKKEAAEKVKKAVKIAAPKKTATKKQS